MKFENVLSYLLELATSFGVKLLAAIVIFFVGSKLIKKIKKFIKGSPKLDKLDASLRSFLGNFSGIALYTLLFITVAMILGIPTTSFLTVLASLGVAIGLALQGALSNFAGGIMILLFKPFKVGDYIEASGEAGTVAEISVVYTVILTLDNKRVTIPNGTLTNSVIENYSAEPLRRVDLTFNASYKNDVDEVKEVISVVVKAHSKVLKTPEAFIRLTKHNENGLEYTVRAWCKNEDYWTVYMDLMENVKKAFDYKGIEIPYPQLDVHIQK